MSKWIRSPLVYQGNKYKLLDFLRSKMPEDMTTIIELFGGSGVISLNFGFKGYKYLYNELDPKVFELFQVFKNNSIEDIERWINEIANETGLINFRTEKERSVMTKEEISLSTKPFYEAKEYINKVRTTMHRDEWVIKTFYISKNSIFKRYIFKGEDFDGGAGEGVKIKGVIDKIANFKFASVNGSMFNESYEIVLNSVINGSLKTDKDKTIIYFDPPYFNTQADYNTNWDIEEENKLLEYLNILNRKGYKWMMSNAPNKHLYEFAKEHGYYVFEKEYKYGMGGGQKDVIEFLMTNYEPPKPKKQLALFEEVM